ncbi:3-deoxy-D-manno-octulosonic-acid transferase [Povalibacter uvarum]|uniref:3-deoxy-D-manno-octulosonic acid transferase n=1 Tax=Povalibacter uvarum TaxID=732238 RepID=A0A841HUT3_9GAMM|nr:lipid IV(A) 3-deoxy-D-manno-octulosonic acid transferase [Povalibacter uvarum]MBB6095718.1 3-deoxy-D-manno-octulosonic-acid transferase [Povalibacter uvarum]
MLRLLYTLLLYVAAPIALAATMWRGVRDPLYRERWGERFGFSRTRTQVPTIWVHAVSVGEVQAAAALIRELRKRYPDPPLIVTTATPTGAQRVNALFGDAVRHVYLPYDLPGAVRRFLDRIQPRIAVMMETEVWPNLYRECGRRQIPIVLASARLSEKSVRRFRRISSLFREALNQDLTIGAQTRADADRFIEVGAPASRVHVTGNIKFDIEVAPNVRATGEALRTAEFFGRFVWIAGSTHEGEEDIVLAAHRQLIAKRSDALLVLVPRHPNRFDRVRQWLGQQGMAFVCRSRGESAKEDTRVVLADTLGELLMLYAAGDVAFVAGSLVPIGGHNLLEPAALARPILTGPRNFNAPDIAKMLFESGGALQVNSADELAATLAMLSANPEKRAELGQAALGILEMNRGAVARVMEMIEKAEAVSRER